MALMRTALAGAILLAASGAAHAQAPSGYEAEPVLNARDLAAPDLLKGPHFTVDPKVPVRGFIARFTIHSPFGTFEAHGLRMLPIRANEMEALAKLDELSRTREFAAAVGRAAARPVTAAANMIVQPVDTIAGLPGGVARLFGRVRLAGSRIVEAAVAPGQTPVQRVANTSRRVGSVAITALGFEEERRRLAERLGVDPYTTNTLLSEKLTNAAWVSFSGRLGVAVTTAILVPYSEVMTAVSVTNRAVWDTPAGDLINNANSIFSQTGANSADVTALMQNPQYSLSVLTALALGLQRLQGLQGRDAVVSFAAAAQTQDEVNFIAGAVNMLARYHESMTPLVRLSTPNPIVGHTAAGALVLAAPVDYVSWIQTLGVWVSRPEIQAPEKVAFLSGQTSNLARKNLNARGWTVFETFTVAAER